MEWTVRALGEQIAAGQIRSQEAVKAFFERIDKIEPQVGAFLTLLKETACEQARSVDEKIAAGQPVGPLAGVPLAIKDNLCMTFGPTTCASKMLEHFYSPYNAHVVEKLMAADAVIVGKTNMDEFGMGSSTENSGLKRTCNPWDTSRVPGGSSGGSTAAVAARMCAGALGSDTGGSIRQPASFCGVVGLKPTYGRVSRYGLAASVSSMDQIGPITQTVEDAAILLNVIAGHDSRDSTCVSEKTAPVVDYTAELDQPLEGLRIAVVESLLEGAQLEVQQAIAEALKVYESRGAQLMPIQMPHFEYAASASYVIAAAEASSNLARYDGVHYGYRSRQARDYMEVYSKSRGEALGPEVKRRIMLGTLALSSGYYDAYYLKALKVRNLIRGDFSRAFERADCLILPTSPTTAFRLGEKIVEPLQMYLSDACTVAVNLAGMPAVSIPCGLDRNRLPIGLQIVTAPFTERALLRIARMYEQCTCWHREVPEIAQ